MNTVSRCSLGVDSCGAGADVDVLEVELTVETPAELRFSTVGIKKVFDAAWEDDDVVLVWAAAELTVPLNVITSMAIIDRNTNLLLFIITSFGNGFAGNTSKCAGRILVPLPC
jgi:hypothetical protein